MQATHVEDLTLKTGQIAGPLMVLHMPGGGEVHWILEHASKIDRAGPSVKAEGTKLVRRQFAKPHTPPDRVEVFGHVAKVGLTHAGRSLRLDVTLEAARGDEVTARRSYQFAASPIAENAP
jgi:hypothetical protein